jgi:hypothetical protein
LPLFGWMAIASTALRNSAELGLTTSVFFARFVAMRLVQERFGESIPAVVIRVYSVRLTVAGEASLRSVTHLEQLPKTLTSTVLCRFGPSLQVAASANFGFSPAHANGDHSIPNLLTVKIFCEFLPQCGLGERRSLRNDS